MIHKIIEMFNLHKEKYGEGTPFDLDYGKLVIIGLEMWAIVLCYHIIDLLNKILLGS